MPQHYVFFHTTEHPNLLLLYITLPYSYPFPTSLTLFPTLTLIPLLYFSLLHYSYPDSTMGQPPHGSIPPAMSNNIPHMGTVGGSGGISMTMGGPSGPIHAHAINTRYE